VDSLWLICAKDGLLTSSEGYCRLSMFVAVVCSIVKWDKVKNMAANRCSFLSIVREEPMKKVLKFPFFCDCLLLVVKRS